MTDALNDVVRRMAGGELPTVTDELSSDGVRLIGIQFPAMSEPSVLVRVTPEDVEMERSRGDARASVESIAASWREALARALDSAVPDSNTGAVEDA